MLLLVLACAFSAESDAKMRIIGRTSAQAWVDEGRKLSHGSFYTFSLAIDHDDTKEGNLLIPAKGQVDFIGARIVEEGQYVPKYKDDAQLGKIKYWAKKYLVQVLGDTMIAKVKKVAQLDPKCLKKKLADKNATCEEETKIIEDTKGTFENNAEFKYDVPHDRFFIRDQATLTAFSGEGKEGWPLDKPFALGHFANPSYAQERSSKPLGKKTFYFKAPLLQGEEDFSGAKKKFCENQKEEGKQFTIVVDGEIMTQQSFNKKWKGLVEFESLCKQIEEDEKRKMFTAARIIFKEDFWKQTFDLGNGIMSFEAHDMSQNFRNGVLIGKGERPRAPWMSALIVVGIVFGFAGAVLALLYYMGEIGNREAMFSDNEEFEMHWLRRMLFPVYGFELAKFLPLTYLFFLGIFVNATFKNIKEPMLTEDLKDLSGLGMVMTNWVKLVLVLAAAFIVSAVLIKLTSKYRLPNLAIGITFVFAIYFTLNGFILFTFRDTLTNKAKSLEWLKTAFGKDLWSRYGQAFCAMFIFWPGTINYVVSELWSAVGMGFVIWGYVNAIHSGHSATRYYSILPALGQIGQMLAAKTIDGIADGTSKKFWSLDKTVYWIHACILVILMCFAGTIYFIDRYIMTKEKYKMPAPQAKKKKAKMGTCSSLAYVFRNPHALMILGMIFCQGAFEVMEQLSYKDAAKIQFDNDNANYAILRANEQFYVGVFALFFMIFLGSNMLRTFGWRMTAFVTPMFVVAMGTVFYITLISGGTYDIGLNFVDIEVTKRSMYKLPKLNFVVTLGFWMNVLMPALKYSLFDATREIAYLSLNKDQRLRVKAVADIIGQRGGKSFAALLNVGFTSYKGIEFPYCMTAFVVFGIEALVWLASVYFLDGYIKTANAKQEDVAFNDEEMKKPEGDEEVDSAEEADETPAEPADDNDE